MSSVNDEINRTHKLDNSTTVITPPPIDDDGMPPNFEIANLRKFLAQKETQTKNNSELSEVVHETELEVNAQPSLGDQEQGRPHARTGKLSAKTALDKINKHFLADKLQAGRNQEKNKSESSAPQTAASGAKLGNLIKTGGARPKADKQSEIVHDLAMTAAAAINPSVREGGKRAIGTVNQQRNTGGSSMRPPVQDTLPAMPPIPPITQDLPPPVNVPVSNELTSPQTPRQSNNNNTSNGRPNNTDGTRPANNGPRPRNSTRR